MAKKGYLPSIDIRKLCTPSWLYFVISMIAYTIMLLQNLGRDNGSYCVGDLFCDATQTELFIIFAIKLIYILFWSWVLDLICKDGYSNISWFLVLFPIVLFFLIISILILSHQKIHTKEGNQNNKDKIINEGMQVSFNIPDALIGKTGNRGYQVGSYEPAAGISLFKF